MRESTTTRWSQERGVRSGGGRGAVRAVALAGTLALVGAGGAGAQATPEAGIVASPTTGSCEAPDQMASTDAGMASPMASPVASEDAAAAPEAPMPTPVEDEATVESAVAAAENFIYCWNAEDADAVVALGTANYLRTQYGIESLEQAAGALSQEGALPPITLLETGDVNVYNDGRASLDLVYLLGNHQYTAARWFMTEVDGELLIDEQTLRLPQPDVEASSVIGVTFADDGTPIAFGQGVNEAGNRETPLRPAIILPVTNDGAEPRSLSVVQVAGSAADAAATPVAGSMPEGDFVAAFGIAPGGQSDVALLDLEVGTYAVGEMGGADGAVLLQVTEPEA